MKHFIFAGVMAVISFLVLAAGMTVSGRSVRKNELQRVLDRAVEQTVEEFSLRKPKGGTQELFLDAFLKQLLQGIESDSEITVYVMGADREKGLLSVRAEEKFFHPGGIRTTVSADKTVVLEQFCLPEKRLLTVTYKIGKNVYKCYCLTEGSRLQVPDVPEGKVLYWTNKLGERQYAGEEVKISRDQVWEAVLD